MRRTLDRITLWWRSQTARATLVSGLTLLAIAVAVAVIVPEWNWKNVGPIKDLAGEIQSALTVFAIVVGGAFALVKLQVFRTFEPHLTVTHKVNHRYVGDSYIHLDVTATLRNSSRVAVGIRDGEFSIQQVNPMPDEEIESVYADVFMDKEFVNLQWPILESVPVEWEEGEMVIEPEESHQETYEFIVLAHMETALIYTYFQNPARPRPSNSAEGWEATTVYDIVTNKGRTDRMGE